MKSKQKTVYYCEHCKKHGLLKWRIEHHEKYCHGNPENLHKCWDCKYLDCDDVYDYEKDKLIGSEYFCLKQQKALYPAKYYEKTYPKRIKDSKILLMMPKECGLFEKKVYEVINLQKSNFVDFDEIDFENPF